MCGISGIISSALLPLESLQLMTDCIRHRGPDDEGFVLFPCFGGKAVPRCGPDTPGDVLKADFPYAPSSTICSENHFYCGLGHRRLAILDLSPLGHQPMSSLDGRYWIVFNGEVYNYIEIRAELETLGYSFVSRTDTEVIIAAYAEWGEDCLSKFNGMWAFAIYDSMARTLFLARDRYGVKPLYYWTSPEGLFAFASEIKQFTVLPGWSARVNGQRAYDYLVFGVTDHTEETMFSGVYQLQPGHCVLLSVEEAGGLPPGSSLTTRAWYELRPKEFAGNFEDAASEFRDLFEQSIALRLRADVPVGSCLSGGLDSSSIVCVLNDFLRKQGAQDLQKTFSACSDVARFDERKWIDIVVGKTGVNAHYVYPVLDRLFEESPVITWHQDEPFGSTSIYAQWCVFKLASESGVKVMLDGQGADELLAGYHPYYAANNTDLAINLKFFSLWHEIKSAKKIRNRSEVRALLEIVHALLPSLLREKIRMLIRPEIIESWIDTKSLKMQGRSSLLFKRQKIKNICDLSRLQLTKTTLPMLLHWEDRDSMAHSIESRVPFLDYKLVEFVLGLPRSHKISDGVTKKILRTAMANILPEQICKRMDKMGFVTPEEYWAKEMDPMAFRMRLERAVEICSSVVKPNILEDFDKFISSRIPYDSAFWRVMNFSEWVNVFNVKLT
jgi:asparagine synthase (glutamine-hydrolysing)